MERNLHLLCQDRNDASTEQVRHLIEQHPSSVFEKDVYGRTPLFYALKRSCSNEIIKLLFDAHPKAVMEPDYCGETPISIIYHSSKDPSILKAMLQSKPSMACQRLHSFSGTDLLHLVCSPWETLGETTTDDVRCNTHLTCQWEKVVLTVSAAHKSQGGSAKTNTNINTSTTCELHVALELPVSPKVLIWFVKMYPSQLHTPMPNGMLPLHKLLTTPKIVNHPQLSAALPYFIDGLAARTEYQGELPLHLAVKAGLEWETGLKQILYAAPEALETPSSSGLLPFMYAAMTRDVSTIYTLIREGPPVSQYL